MNPFERRIIHMALKSERDIETQSEGEGTLKQIKIFLKQRDKEEKKEEEKHS